MSRTVIDIEDKFLKKAQKLTGINKKVEIVNYAIKKLILVLCFTGSYMLVLCFSLTAISADLSNFSHSFFLLSVSLSILIEY